MCVVSMVVDGVRDQYPPIQQWPYPVATDMSEVIRRLSEIDEKLGAKDCYDPKKEQFLKDLADRVEALEKAQKKPRKAKAEKGQ